MKNSKPQTTAPTNAAQGGKWIGKQTRTFLSLASNLANPQPGGYLTGDLWLLPGGQISRRKTPGARFAGNLFVVDEQGQVWLGVRRSVWAEPGALCKWYAAKIESGRTTTGTPAPENWYEFVSAASLVIPLLSKTST